MTMMIMVMVMKMMMMMMTTMMMMMMTMMMMMMMMMIMLPSKIICLSYWINVVKISGPIANLVYPWLVNTIYSLKLDTVSLPTCHLLMKRRTSWIHHFSQRSKFILRIHTLDHFSNHFGKHDLMKCQVILSKLPIMV